MKIFSCRTHSPIAGTCPSIGAWQQRGCGSTKHPKPDEASTANAAVVLLRRTRRNFCESSTKVQGQHVALQRKKESWDEDSKQMWIITLEFFRCASASFQYYFSVGPLRVTQLSQEQWLLRDSLSYPHARRVTLLGPVLT